MPNSSLPAQSSAQTVVTANTDTTAPSQSPTININLPKLPSSALRDPNLIEVGGGLIPGFQCSRQNLILCKDCCPRQHSAGVCALWEES